MPISLSLTKSCQNRLRRPQSAFTEKQIADGRQLSPRELVYYGREAVPRPVTTQQVLVSFLGTGKAS